MHINICTTIYGKLTCHANCTFSNCDITITVVKGSGKGVACGCYFGIDSCRSGDAISSVDGESTIVEQKIDRPKINEFISYLLTLTNALDFSNVIASLNAFYSGMSTAQYEEALDVYRINIEALSTENKEIIRS
ncbi:MAG: hypothetical protein JSS78_11445 [Bacteroidetes bacterium]|nr:hypothetical protein [Bacteroidota bacterium]